MPLDTPEIPNRSTADAIVSMSHLSDFQSQVISDGMCSLRELKSRLEEQTSRDNPENQTILNQFESEFIENLSNILHIDTDLAGRVYVFLTLRAEIKELIAALSDEQEAFLLKQAAIIIAGQQEPIDLRSLEAEHRPALIHALTTKYDMSWPTDFDMSFFFQVAYGRSST